MKIYVMDAFAAKLFGGNQAGVALPEGDVSDETMRLIAAELKHSETAFVRPQEDGSVDLRYFTPAGEVELCGHATIAAFALLRRLGGCPTDATLPAPRPGSCRSPWTATWCGWTWPRPGGWGS